MGLTDKKITIRFSRIGLLGGMFLVFLFLKLAEMGVVAKWSWWWVTAPLWAPFAIVLGIAIIWFVVKIIVMLILTYFQNKRRYK